MEDHRELWQRRSFGGCISQQYTFPDVFSGWCRNIKKTKTNLKKCGPEFLRAGQALVLMNDECAGARRTSRGAQRTANSARRTKHGAQAKHTTQLPPELVYVRVETTKLKILAKISGEGAAGRCPGVCPGRDFGPPWLQIDAREGRHYRPHLDNQIWPRPGPSEGVPEGFRKVPPKTPPKGLGEGPWRGPCRRNRFFDSLEGIPRGAPSGATD